MAKYTQANRRMRVTTPLGEDVLLLTGFQGSEGISELFRFQLDLAAPDRKAVVFDRILGQKVTVRLEVPGSPVRYFNGIVNRFVQGKRDSTFTYYQAEVVPQLWLLTRKAQCRIFQQQSVPDILRTVLQGLDVQFEIQGNFLPRDYCVQYRETDFAFASRLMEEEGIFYYFKHSASGHPMVVANTALACPDLAQSHQVIYEELEGGFRDDCRIVSWDKAQELTSGKFTLWDHCFELTGQGGRAFATLAADQAMPESARAGTMTHPLQVGGSEKLEIYDYPGRYAQRFDGVGPGGEDRSSDLANVFTDNQRTVKLRMEEAACHTLRIDGVSNAGHFAPGCKFTLERHFDGDGDYLLRKVEHSAQLASDPRPSEEPRLTYRNRFTCLPAGLPYRPPLTTPRPIISGTQTATVVGPPGQEVFLDKYGRVKVQFPWDRQGQFNAGSSCWIRVAQFWAGKRWGAFFWPRVGHEVVVAFEEGDPDRPIIVGSVYNAANLPPFALPANSMVEGIKSASIGSGSDPTANFHGLIFYDKLGQEHVQLHSERFETSNSESHKHVHVGGNHVLTVGGIPSLVGSGSGGGDDGESSPYFASIGDLLPDDWNSWAQNLALTVGEKVENVLGLSGDYIIGDHVEMVVNPLGYLGQIGGDTGGAIFKAIAGVFGGALTLVLGAETKLVYGPEIKIHRGAEIEFRGELTAGYLIAANLTAATAMAGSILAGLAPTDQGKQGVLFGCSAAAGVMGAILVRLESANGIAQAAEDQATQAKNLTDRATDVATKVAQGMFDTAARRITEAKDLAQQAVDSIAAANRQLDLVGQRATEAKTEATNNNRTINGNYTINAQDINLISLNNLLRTATTINIDAQGGGNDLGNGTLSLNGTGGVGITSGPAQMSLFREGPVGGIQIDCGKEGMMVLHQGLPDEGPQISLAPEGMTLSVGPPGEGSSITLTAEGLFIRFAEWEIAMDAAGIQLLVAENSLEITEEVIELEGADINVTAESGFQVEALNIDLTAEVGYELEAAVLEETIEGEVTRVAGITMEE